MNNKQHNQNQLSNKIFITKTRPSYKKKTEEVTLKSSRKPKPSHVPKSFEEVIPQLIGESEAQYKNLQLYCEAGSLVKLRAKLAALANNKQAPFFTRRGGLPYRRTLDRWCCRFRWVKRKEKWTREQCKETYFWFTDQRRNNPSFLMAVKLRQRYTKATPKNGGENSPILPQNFSRNDGNGSAVVRQNDGRNRTNSGQNRDEINNNSKLKL
ncbi:hypothetical protein IPM65_02025 [Candidatus Roizmanbacteria bacterium]|nr:MAG: hypothetical protein IPM65_02025 [Candidatus Roizmanbacteria bacterium]